MKTATFQYTDTETERIYQLGDDELRSDNAELEAAVTRFMQKNSREVILDFSNVGRINSRCLATLVRIKKRAAELGRTVRIANTAEGIVAIMNVAGLDGYLLES